MFEVLSLDWWGRYRTEGYGYVTLPSTSGLHQITSHTWRPIGNSPVNELRRFFIGGDAQLDDIMFVGVPHQFEVCAMQYVYCGKCKKSVLRCWGLIDFVVLYF